MKNKFILILISVFSVTACAAEQKNLPIPNRASDGKSGFLEEDGEDGSRGQNGRNGQNGQNGGKGGKSDLGNGGNGGDGGDAD